MITFCLLDAARSWRTSGRVSRWPPSATPSTDVRRAALQRRLPPSADRTAMSTGILILLLFDSISSESDSLLLLFFWLFCPITTLKNWQWFQNSLGFFFFFWLIPVPVGCQRKSRDPSTCVPIGDWSRHRFNTPVTGPHLLEIVQPHRTDLPTSEDRGSQ